MGLSACGCETRAAPSNSLATTALFTSWNKVVADNLEKIAKAHGRTVAQEALAWMLSKPYITAPIVGTTSVQHVVEAVYALDIKLDEEEIKAPEAPYVPHIKTGAF